MRLLNIPATAPGAQTTDTPAVPDRLIEQAIALEQVDVLFQPLIEPLSGCVVGAEALARSSIAVSAEQLFARAERAGAAERLSRLVQRKALTAAATWEGPLKGLSISINLLPGEIAREGFERSFLETLDTAGVDPGRVIVEITENALLVGDQGVPERLSALRERGVRIAIDDFGTGYSSLAYLTTLPLDLKVVVEGVESCGQLTLLAEWGCDLYQGFLGAGALTHVELVRFVTATQIREVA